MNYNPKDLELIIDGEKWNIVTAEGVLFRLPYHAVDTSIKTLYLYNVQDKPTADKLIYQTWLGYHTI